MTSSEIRKEARAGLSGKWGKAILIIIVTSIVGGLITSLLNLAGENSVLSLIISIISFLVSAPLALGLVFAFMKLKRNDEVNAFSSITLGFSNFGKSWRVYLSMIVAMIIPIILMIVSYVIFAIGMVKYVNINIADIAIAPEITFTSELGSPVLMIIGLLLIVASGIYSYIKSLSISLSMNVAFDEPELTGKQTVKKSQELMKGNKMKLFILTLSFIGWAILSVITFGLGMLWLIPYMQVSFIAFYEALAGKTVTTNA